MHELDVTITKLAKVLGQTYEEAQRYYDVLDPFDQRLFVKIANMSDDLDDLTDE